MDSAAFDASLSAAWEVHAQDPRGVAAGLDGLLAQVDQAEPLSRLCGLALHVWGEHLGAWPEALAWLDRARAATAGWASPEAAAAAPVLDQGERLMRLCLGLVAPSVPTTAETPWASALAGLGASDQLRLLVGAANQLGSRPGGPWLAVASRLLAATAVPAAALPDTDPAVRHWAAQSNNLAGNLREQAPLAAEAAALMCCAAETACQAWSRAGTWLQVERAEYLLAQCLLTAGQPAQALVHARTCADIVAREGQVPLEAFFAAEVVALAAHACGDGPAWTAALQQAEAAYAALPDADRPWCDATWAQLRAQQAPSAAG